MFVLIPRSHTYTATEVLPLQGNTLWLKPGLPQRQHFTSSKTYQEASLAMPTQSYKCSLSPRESWLRRGFVLRFSSETQGPEETHLLLCPGPWQSPENVSYISQHTGMALTPQNCFAHNIKSKCHFFSHIITSQKPTFWHHTLFLQRASFELKHQKCLLKYLF